MLTDLGLYIRDCELLDSNYTNDFNLFYTDKDQLRTFQKNGEGGEID